MDKEQLRALIVQDLDCCKLTLPINENWVTLRHKKYPIFQASMKENRYNKTDVPAWYTASGIDVAHAEVGSHSDLQTYRMRSGPYVAFNTITFSERHGLTDDFNASKESGGYGFCQDVAEIVTSLDTTISGMLYASCKMAEDGMEGYCLAILPQKEIELHDGFFRIVEEEDD
jgi:hypothetical protein